MQLAKKKL